MDRREFIAATGFVLSGPLVGCLSGATANEAPDRPWTPSDSTATPDGAHHLFVENYTGTTETAWLRVVRKDGVALVDGRYELPDERGIKFESIAAWETTYTVELAIDGEDVTSMKWHTEECSPGSEAPGDRGSRNAAVRITDASEGERVSLVVDQCDALHSPGLPTGSAETFRLDG